MTAVVITAVSSLALAVGKTAVSSTAPLKAGELERARASTSKPVRLDRCRAARRAHRWYSQWHRYWLHKMGAASADGNLGSSAHRAGGGCPRYLSKVFRTKAHQARERYERWQKRQRHERLTYFRDLYEKWRCIHEHEGAWNSNTGNGYYGGLQMDYSFQSAYGPEFLRRWGYAHQWPVWAQLTAAERAYRSRGFNPWPNTARMCGVL